MLTLTLTETLLDLEMPATVSPAMSHSTLLGRFSVNVEIVRTTDPDDGSVRFWVDVRSGYGSLSSSKSFGTEREALRHAYKLGN